MEITPIARVRTPFPQKFGIPRQSNIVLSLTATLVFEPEFRNPDALRGIEGFDFLWLIWQFSENIREGWSPTVRPPRLGGNTRLGVFATRSSFRPNSLALSSVRLLSVEWESHEGPLLHIAGVDLLDGTPVFDEKPYIPYTDSHPEARSGFAPSPTNHLLRVCCPDSLIGSMPSEEKKTLLELLSHDPRPAYHHDHSRIYTMRYRANTSVGTVDYDIGFIVPDDDTLEVVSVCVVN